MIIDAHHHLWTADYAWLADPSLTPIRRDYTIDDLRVHLRAAGIDATVLVEAGRCDDAETREFLSLAANTPEIAAVVGWASLEDPVLADTLAAHRAGAGGRYLAGIRDQVQGHPDDFLDRPSVRTGLRTVARAGLVNELVVRPSQLPAVIRAVDAVPGTTFVLDHLGKPRVAAGPDGLAEWRTLIAPLAEREHVIVKLSGLVAEADWATWTVDDLRPFVETALGLFGPDRLMFGSDWPVCEVAASYEQVVDAIETILGGRPENVFATTAARTYMLEGK
ncbi:amidohydrolase family protein [Actinoallomurus sp. NPDC052308]|uniref:amidohydrolase family protein n=1 Tax=Actinoallomurus sp. NPDC052308 TaxID=3155530 RepID=UPI00342B5B78